MKPTDNPGRHLIRGRRVSVTLGMIGVAAATIVLIDPRSPMAAIGVFALIAFNLVTGWKVYTLSRAT